MRFKLIMALVDDHYTDDILAAAREAGATGSTVVTSARGEGLKPEKTFLGLEIAGQRDLLMFLVVEQLSREILETISAAGEFEEKPGCGIAFQIDIEDAVGLQSQLKVLTEEIEEQL
jgi:nitrogen regulatory protein PII